jgi:hypothetical protein
MSTDEVFLAKVLRALETAQLEALVVGSVAAALQGAPVLTQDLDLLVRDTPKNREKLVALGDLLGTGKPVQISELSPALRFIGADAPVDILFDRLSGTLTYASLKSRAIEVDIAGAKALVACLDDVIRSKEAAGRAKDKAQLPILREAARVKKALED